MAKKKEVKKENKNSECNCDSKCNCNKAGGGCLYGIGFIGSAVYFISTATSFWGGVWGFLKSLVWPAFLVFELFKFLRI
jgi:hypothetical protein